LEITREDLKLISVTLSLWDTGGQERFSFFKTDFFKGVAAVALVFDLSRPDTFESVDEYFNDIRELSGNIPIILVGNKDDLRKDVGETIPREKIIQMVNQYNLFEYIETSALENLNVETLFNRLALISLIDLQPRLGEIIDSNHFRFKVLLVGAAAVGKSTLINVFTKKRFEENYKLTVGLDFMIQFIEIEEENIPNETLILMKNTTKKKRIKKIRKKEEVQSSSSS
jgi:small GTP-binding protein